jgi:hypothetical protein
MRVMWRLRQREAHLARYTLAVKNESSCFRADPPPGAAITSIIHTHRLLVENMVTPPHIALHWE